MARGYFDLQPPPGLRNYSMVRHLTDRGFVVVTLDPPAVGESDEPDDGYTLTPDLVADVHTHTFDQLLARWPDATRIGVGHSAGALLTVVQQARHRTFDSARALRLRSRWARALRAHDRGARAGGRDRRAATRERFDNPLPGGSTSTSPFLLGGMDVPPDALAALGSVKSRLLAVVGLVSMIPRQHRQRDGDRRRARVPRRR